MNSHQTWSIVILCYNEVATIRRVIKNALEVLDLISPTFHELIVVDDGSHDGSAELIDQLARQYPSIRTIRHEANLGIGPSLRDGYQAARGENVVAIPADGQFDTRELIPHASLPPRTLLAFYRHTHRLYSPWHMVRNVTHRLMNRYLFGCDVKDINWVTVYKTAALQQLDLQLTRYLVDSEICAKMVTRGFRVYEVHSVYHRRVAGAGKGSPLTSAFPATVDAVKLWRMISRQRKAAV